MFSFASFASAEENTNMLALVFICMVSRACSAIGVSTLRPMGHSEYAGNFQKGISKGNITAISAILVISVALAYLICGNEGLVSCFATVIGYIICTAYAFKNLDGFSGDVTGFGHTLAELFGIVALTVF